MRSLTGCPDTALFSSGRRDSQNGLRSIAHAAAGIALSSIPIIYGVQLGGWQRRLRSASGRALIMLASNGATILFETARLNGRRIATDGNSQNNHGWTA